MITIVYHLRKQNFISWDIFSFLYLRHYHISFIGKIIIENYMFKNKIEYDIIQEKNRIINLLENNNIF